MAGVSRALGTFVILAAAAAAVGAAHGEPPDEATLHYRASVAGTPVGTALVRLNVTNRNYRIEGEASSNGWLKSFATWRNSFGAAGELDGGTRRLSEFGYREQNGHNLRDVAIRDGVLTVHKNGRPRAERPSPSGLDLLSALFVHPTCGLDEYLHTGRRVYRLTRLEVAGERCSFEVADEDGDRFELELTLGEYHGLIVPARVTVRAWLTGRIDLVDASSVAPVTAGRE